MQKETKVGAEVEEVPEIPMPEWEKDKKKVKEEQLEDKTLDQERGWADNQERDFEWRNGLLCHINYASPKLRIQRLQPWLGVFSFFLPLFQYFDGNYLIAISVFFKDFYRCDIQQAQKVGGGQGAAVLRVVVVDEVEHEKLDKTKLLGKEMSEEQQKQLTGLLGTSMVMC